MDHASGVPDLSFHLLHEITDGFSPDRILGIGSFGKVYMVRRLTTLHMYMVQFGTII